MNPLWKTIWEDLFVSDFSSTSSFWPGKIMAGGDKSVVARCDIGEETAVGSGITFVWFWPPKPIAIPTRQGLIEDLSNSLASYSLSLVLEEALRGLRGRRGIDNLEGSLGVKDCERLCTWVGEVIVGIGPSSRTGAEIEIETDGKAVVWGGEDDGGVELTVGKGCRPLATPEGEVGLAWLWLRLRYSTIRSWKEGLTGGKSVAETLLRSSADLDHPFFEMLLRSPRPVTFLEVGLLGELVPWSPDGSTDPGLRTDRSKTDLAKDRKIPIRNRRIIEVSIQVRGGGGHYNKRLKSRLIWKWKKKTVPKVKFYAKNKKSCKKRVVEDYLPTSTSSVSIKNWPWICRVRNLVFSSTGNTKPWLRNSWRCLWRRHATTEPLWRFCQELSESRWRGSRAWLGQRPIRRQRICLGERIATSWPHPGDEIVKCVVNQAFSWRKF